MAEQYRFCIFVPNNSQTDVVRRGSFCCWECAAAYNASSRCKGSEEEQQKRHALIEGAAGRPVLQSPAQQVLKRQQIARREWLVTLRSHLHEYQDILDQEMCIEIGSQHKR